MELSWSKFVRACRISLDVSIFKEFLSEREQAAYVKKLLDGRLSKTLKGDIAIIGRTKNQLLNFKIN